MDSATLIGIISGFGLIGLSIFTQAGWQFFFNANAFFIVFGGTVAATLINYPLADVLKMIAVAKNTMVTKETKLAETLEFLIELSKKARQDGVLALGEMADSMEDEFGKKGLQLVVDKVDSKTVSDILEAEIGFIEERHEIGQKIFKSMAAYSPAFGMVGTLIGLIQMLQKLDDPSKIGVGMAVALVTTLYGVVFANLLYIPFAGKLETRSRQEIMAKEMMMVTLSSIQANDNPRLLYEKLVSIIPPKMRGEVDIFGDGGPDEQE